ncbi:MAG: DsbA family protein [Acidobacteriia bacterium]|nr:DsbA family protein [Terriglobia bacterium]
MKGLSKSADLVLGFFLLIGGARLIADSTRPTTTPPKAGVLQNKILRFVRARFGVPENVKLTVDAPRPANHPAFLQMTITADDGKQKRPNSVLITKDYHYLILGSTYPVTGDPRSEVTQRVREQFKFPASTVVTATDFHPSPYPNLLATTITVDDGKHTQTQNFYLTKDQRCLVLGSIYDLGLDPRREALRIIRTDGQPGQGSVSAPVTIVEFADLECPMCARLHDFLESDLLPKYGDKVRIVYKEFPLLSIHEWTLTASLACQCAYQMNPGSYVPLRSMIFKNQAGINGVNARDLMLSYGEQVGLDRLRLAACIDSKAPLPRIEADVKEGQALGISSTPTCFVNGKMVVGFPSPEAYYQAVNESLRAAK